MQSTHFFPFACVPCGGGLFDASLHSTGHMSGGKVVEYFVGGFGDIVDRFWGGKEFAGDGNVTATSEPGILKNMKILCVDTLKA